MDQLSILVAGQNSKDGRPVTLQVFSIAHDLTLLGVKVGVRLQPPARSSSNKLSTQAFPSSCYWPVNRLLLDWNITTKLIFQLLKQSHRATELPNKQDRTKRVINMPSNTKWTDAKLPQYTTPNVVIKLSTDCCRWNVNQTQHCWSTHPPSCSSNYQNLSTLQPFRVL